MNPVIKTLLLAAAAISLVIGAFVAGFPTVGFFVLVAAACWVAAQI